LELPGRRWCLPCPLQSKRHNRPGRRSALYVANNLRIWRRRPQYAICNVSEVHHVRRTPFRSPSGGQPVCSSARSCRPPRTSLPEPCSRRGLRHSLNVTQRGKHQRLDDRSLGSGRRRWTAAALAMWRESNPAGCLPAEVYGSNPKQDRAAHREPNRPGHHRSGEHD